RITLTPLTLSTPPPSPHADNGCPCPLVPHASVVPCGLVAGRRSLRAPRCKWLCPRAATATMGDSPCGLALVASSRPFARGLGRSRSLLYRGPWLQPVAPV
ncbi:hypothetical protein B296_00011496, partial [Ensete ventricosum]